MKNNKEATNILMHMQGWISEEEFLKEAKRLELAKKVEQIKMHLVHYAQARDTGNMKKANVHAECVNKIQQSIGKHS